MILESLELKSFRLHKKSIIKFSGNLNYIVGGNGQGKTTILEAIYYLCTTKSLSQSPDSESVNFQSGSFEIKGKFKDKTENKVRIYFDLSDNKKSYFLDTKQIYRSSGVIGKFPVVTLTQSDHFITDGAPADRRKFVDSVISQSSETYLKILLEYNKTLRQRSSLLTQIKETNNTSLFIQLDAWTETLIKTGTELVKHRIAFVNEFNNYVEDAYRHVMNEKETPEIDYSFYGCKDKEEIEEVFKREIDKNRQNELRRTQNLIGPHKDEFLFKINDIELRKYGSQGQHKTFQIALRFGQFFFLKDITGRTPIFLMDDIFGELDAFRAGKISEYMKEVGQAFITLTDFSNFDYLHKSEEDLLVNVENGEVKYV